MKRHYIFIAFSFFLVTSLYAQDANKLKVNVNKGSIALASEDANFKYSFGGRVYMDAASYFDDKTDLGTGSELRDIRLLFKATVWEKWNAKINLTFAGGKVAAKDIFAQYNFNKKSHLRIGYFYEPFGLERTESSKTVKFLEISSTNEAFGPGRGLGFQYAVSGKRYYWGAGLFGDNDINNTSEGDEGFAISSRFVYAPLNKDGKVFHIGTSLTHRTASANGYDEDGSEAAKNIRYRSRAATHIEGRRFVDAKVSNADSQFKYGIEILAASGPLSFQGEAIGAKVKRKDGLEDYSAMGWYGQIGYLLKGGKYKYKMGTARLAKPGPGSIELLARYNQTDLNDTDVMIMGGEQKDFSLGFIYYINHNMLVKLNYVNVDVDKNNAISGMAENFNILQTRFQFAF
jgi:phosphate-selective porin OprO/OprP